jgi:hypothetical protein
MHSFRSLRISWQRAVTEFVVILCGVLAALATDSAMEDYRQRQSAREALISLRDDITSDFQQLESYWVRQLQQQQDGRRRLEEFLQGSGAVEDSFEFVNDVRWISSYYTFNPNTAGLEDLINTGGLSLIEDINLRKALLNYRGEIENIVEFDSLHRAYFLELYGELSSRIVGRLALAYSLDAVLGNISKEIARAEAIDAIDEGFIRSSDMLRRLLVNTAQAQQIKQNRYLNIRDDARALITMLDEALGEF